MKPIKAVLLGTLVGNMTGDYKKINKERLAEIDISKVKQPEKLDERTLNRILREFRVDKELFSVLENIIDGKRVDFTDEIIDKMKNNEALKNVILQSSVVSDETKAVISSHRTRSPNGFKYVVNPSYSVPADIKNAKSYLLPMDKVGKQFFSIKTDEEFLAKKENYKKLMLSGRCTTEDYEDIISNIYKHTDDSDFKKMVLSGIQNRGLQLFYRDLSSAVLYESDVSVIEHALEHFGPNLLCREENGRYSFPLLALYKFYPTLTDKMGENLLNHSHSLMYLKGDDAKVFSAFLVKTHKMPDIFYENIISYNNFKNLTFEECVDKHFVNKDIVNYAVAASAKTPIKYLEQISKMENNPFSLVAKANLSLVGMVSDEERGRILNTIFRENDCLDNHRVVAIDNKARKILFDVLHNGPDNSFPNQRQLTQMLMLNNPMINKFNPNILGACAAYLGMEQDRGYDILNAYFMTKLFLNSNEYKFVMVEHEMQKEYEAFREKEKLSADKGLSVDELLANDDVSVPTFAEEPKEHDDGDIDL